MKQGDLLFRLHKGKVQDVGIVLNQEDFPLEYARSVVIVENYHPWNVFWFIASREMLFNVRSIDDVFYELIEC